MEVAGGDRGERVVTLGERPGAPVPHHDVAAAVLAGRDHALEVEVVERVVLDVGGEALDVGSSVGPFGTAQLSSTPAASSRKS